ncbi:MAG TPA: protein translocase subunit SecD [Gaiellaceae bacterium]
MSDRRSHLVLIGAIAAALIGAVLLAIPGSPIHKKPTLGLDLQGGLEVVLKAVPPKGHKLTQDDLDRSVTIIEKRINGLGVSEPDVRKQPPDQIVIQLAGVHDPAKAARIIGSTAALEFFDLEADVTGPSKDARGNVVAFTSLYDLLSRVESQAKGKNAGPYYLFKSKTTGTGKKAKTVHSRIAGPAPTEAQLLKPYGGKVPEGAKVLAVPGAMTAISCPIANGCPGITQTTAPAATYYYLFKYHPNSPDGPPELTGKDLKLSGTRADFDPNTSQPVTLLDFTGHGSSQFRKITKAEYDRGKDAAGLAGQAGNRDPNVIQAYAGHSAIVLDNIIQSTPYIDYTDPTLSSGISGGAQITTQTAQEAKDLALVLQTGALPVTYQQIERTDVSATLGKDSLREAWHAALVGLVLVAVFLLVLYRFLGLVAVIGLAIYAALYYAAILLFNVTLTLPGFAGLILTIGVAADANVVIFERIKEEVRAGKSVRAAIAAGYGKGFHTIVDANVVTAITALVLFAVATAGVKGFALTLLIGTVISLLTAVAATRAMLGLLAGFKWFNNPRFMGAAGQQHGRFLQIDFMGKRNLWFGISAVIIAVGMVALGVKGLNLGIDFKGGTQVTFRTHQPHSTGDVQQVAADIGHPDAVIQGRGSQSGDQYTNFQIRMRSITQAQTAQLEQDLQTKVSGYGYGIKNVSASFGRQIAHDAILAIIVSLILIVIYITLRFDLKFAIPVIVAMLHDILITVGVYALVGREVSTSTVAAVLTVLGYSIYDTIIIFDRVRENIPLMRRAPFATIANVSLWETIRRSLATTFITLLPVVALLVLGGATLKDFAFALLVGILSGAYSSIFIAAPLLTMWKEREPEYARRRGQQPATVDGQLALAEAETAAAATPAPELSPVAAPQRPVADPKREQRRQRRRSRPHGRAR